MINSIHLEDFRVLSGVRDFEFPPGIVGIVGPNGQGKSTLINSVAWAMYGPEALPQKARDPVTWGAKSTLVRVGMDLNDGSSWFIERTQKPTGTGKARLYTADQIKAEGSAPVTAAVTELLGVDREGFLISVFARQFELDRLRSMDPTPRMQTVLRLLGINQITKAIKLVREDGTEERKSLDALRGHQIDAEAVEEEVRSLEAELVVTNLEIEQQKALVQSQQTEIATLTEQRNALEPQRKAYMSYVNELQSRKTTLRLAEVSAQQAQEQAQSPEPERPIEPDYKSPPEVTDEEVEAKKVAYFALRDQYAALKAEHDSLISQSLGMKDSCPTCGRAFDDAAHIEREKQRIDARVASLTAEMEALAHTGRAAQSLWEQIQKDQEESVYITGFNQRLEEGYKAQVRQYELTMAHRAQAQERLQRTQADLTAAQTALADLKEVSDATAEEDRLRNALATTNYRLNTYIQSLAALESGKQTLEALLKSARGVLKRSADSIAKVKKVEKTVVQVETTASELQALKEKLIGNIIPSLNERASTLVDVMTDGKYSELSLTPDYEIEYRNALGEYKNFLNLSGGEQTVFALALRLAISDLRAGNLGVMFLDEAISNLSSEDGRQESVWEAIESLTSRFRQVFVITHVEAYKDRAPFTVRL